MPTFRRKATTVRAVQFTGGNWSDVVVFSAGSFHAREGAWILDTPSGPVPIAVGDYIAQNPKDATDFYPIMAAQFAELYEPV